MPRFDRDAAVRYAERYALSPNAAYPPFANDCTSFVSQAMLAGGWTMIGGSVLDRQGDNVWWWGKSNFTKASYTWGGAHNFSRFLTASGRAASCARDELALADVVQIAERGHVFHSMIVTTITTQCTPDGDGPLASFHTTNTLNKDLGKIEASYPPAQGFSFLYWKIADSI